MQKSWPAFMKKKRNSLGLSLLVLCAAAVPVASLSSLRAGSAFRPLENTEAAGPGGQALAAAAAAGTTAAAYAAAAYSAGTRAGGAKHPLPHGTPTQASLGNSDAPTSLGNEVIASPLTLTDGGLVEEVFYFQQGTRLTSLDKRRPSQVLSASVISYSPSSKDTSLHVPWTGLMRITNFAVRWSGFMTISRLGKYTFFLASDDGSQLYVDDALLVNNDGCHSMLQVSSSAPMSARTYPIKLEYFQKDAAFGMVFTYNGPDTGMVTIVTPAQVFRKAPWVNDIAPGQGPIRSPATLGTVEKRARNEYEKAKHMLDQYKQTQTNVQEHAFRTHAAIQTVTYAKLAWKWSNAAVAAKTYAASKAASKECMRALRNAIQSANRAADKQSIAVGNSATEACRQAETMAKNKQFTEASQRLDNLRIAKLTKSTQNLASKANFFWKKEQTQIFRASKTEVTEAVAEAENARKFTTIVDQAVTAAKQFYAKITDFLKLQGPQSTSYFMTNDAAFAKRALQETMMTQRHADDFQAAKDSQVVKLMHAAEFVKNPMTLKDLDDFMKQPLAAKDIIQSPLTLTDAPFAMAKLTTTTRILITGCTFVAAPNYDKNAVVDDGSCFKAPAGAPGGASSAPGAAPAPAAYNTAGAAPNSGTWTRRRPKLRQKPL